MANTQQSNNQMPLHVVPPVHVQDTLYCNLSNYNPLERKLINTNDCHTGNVANVFAWKPQLLEIFQNMIETDILDIFTMAGQYTQESDWPFYLPVCSLQTNTIGILQPLINPSEARWLN